MVPIFLQKRRSKRQTLESVGLLIGILSLAGIYCLVLVYMRTNRSLNQAANLAGITVSLPVVLAIAGLMSRRR